MKRYLRGLEYHVLFGIKKIIQFLAAILFLLFLYKKIDSFFLYLPKTKD